MKFFILLIFYITLVAETTNICILTSNKNIESIQINFAKYLKQYGDFKFKIFHDKKSLNSYIYKKRAILILSSLDYKNILQTNKLDLKLVAQKNNSIRNVKVLVGKKNNTIHGIVTSADTIQHTKDFLKSLTKHKKLSTLIVPKEIDALMSVGFGMSDFAIISKDTFTYLQDVNGFLTQDLKIYREVASSYRMVIAVNKNTKIDEKMKNIFKDMKDDDTGKLILNYLQIDRFIDLKIKNKEGLQ